MAVTGSAGKTTCIRLLLGFLHPSAGSARVLGLDTQADGVAIRGRAGYLPGGVALYDAMTGTELLDYLGAFYGRPASRRRFCGSASRTMSVSRLNSAAPYNMQACPPMSRKRTPQVCRMERTLCIGFRVKRTAYLDIKCP